MNNTDKVKEKYSLNCEICGGVFESNEAFPERQVCPKCKEVELSGVDPKANWAMNSRFTPLAPDEELELTPEEIRNAVVAAEDSRGYIIRPEGITDNLIPNLLAIAKAALSKATPIIEARKDAECEQKIGEAATGIFEHIEGMFDELSGTYWHSERWLKFKEDWASPKGR